MTKICGGIQTGTNLITTFDVIFINFFSNNILVLNSKQTKKNPEISGVEKKEVPLDVAIQMTNFAF